MIPHGIHPGVPQSIYRAHPGISNSDLKYFARSPMHYQHAKAHPAEPTAAMIRGTLFHSAILEPATFGEGKSHYVRPDGMKFTTKEGKAWKEMHEDLPIIDVDEAKAISGAREAIMANTMARFFLEQPGRAEDSVFALHQPTGLTIKTRPDWHCEDAENQPWIVDIKTTDDARRFQWAVRDFGYDRQASMYIDNFERVGVPGAKFVFLVIELEPPHGFRMIELDEADIERARMAYEADIIRLSECEKTGVWQGYLDKIEKITLFK